MDCSAPSGSSDASAIADVAMTRGLSGPASATTPDQVLVQTQVNAPPTRALANTPDVDKMDVDDPSVTTTATTLDALPTPIDVDAILTSDDDDIIDMTPETPILPFSAASPSAAQHQKRSATAALGPTVNGPARQRPRRVSPNRLAPHQRPVTPTPTSSLIPPPDGFFDLFKASVAYRQAVVNPPTVPPGAPRGIRWVHATIYSKFPQDVTRHQIRDAIEEIMDLLAREPKESIRMGHRMSAMDVSPNMRVILFGLRMCVIAVARLVVRINQTEAAIATACYEGHTIMVAENGSKTGHHLTPFISDHSKLARFLAIDPMLSNPPPASILSYALNWITQGLGDKTWLDKNRCHYPRAVYVLQLVTVTSAMHRARLHGFDHQYLPHLQIYSRLGLTAPPMGHDPMHTNPDYQLLLALRSSGVKNLAKLIALMRRHRIQSFSQPMLHAMMELLVFYRLWKTAYPHIPPPPFTIIWDGDNREPTQDLLEQAQVKWVDIHVHALQAHWTKWICKSTNTRVGTFHTAVRHASESADFEALFQLVANLPALRFRPLLVVSHDGSFGIMQATHAATMGAMRMAPDTMGTAAAQPAQSEQPGRVQSMVEAVFKHNFGVGDNAFLRTRPEEENRLKGEQPPRPSPAAPVPLACGHNHNHNHQGQPRRPPALPDASRPGWTFWARSVDDARFWVEWARLCVTGYDDKVERDYYWPGAAFKNISGLFEDDGSDDE